MRNGEQNVSLLAQLLMACTCGGAKLDYSPKLTDCLLQIALIKIRDSAIEDCLGVTWIESLQYFAQQLDRLIVLLVLDLCTAAANQVIRPVLQAQLGVLLEVAQCANRPLASIGNLLHLLRIHRVFLALDALEVAFCPATYVVRSPKTGSFLAIVDQVVVERPGE